MNTTRTLLLAAVSAAVLVSAQARADDYSDLLDVLRAKGSLTKSEYRSLMAKHMHKMGMSAPEDMSNARQAAVQAAASAAAAQDAMRQVQDAMKKTEDMMASPDIVHAMPYKPGAGLTMKVGDVDLNISGIVNAFYTYSTGGTAGPTHVVAGGLTESSGFDSSSVRNGLLPGAIIVSASTVQDGVTIDAVFGAYPGIDSSAVGALNANNGGNATALGTAGVDFRKTYISFGTPEYGTVKMGRDIGLFGQDAILNDQTLLGVGATGGNADPGNTSLGRIGYGYIYTDFMPQITYISPIFGGFQASVGIFQPLNEVNLFSGDLSSTSSQHSAPMFQGRVTYDYKTADWTAHLWAGGVAQSHDAVTDPTFGVNYGSKTAVAGEAGAAVTLGPVGLTGYYYRGRGVGTTAFFFDGIAANGEMRDSEGGYVQASIKATDKLKLIGSYGVSSLYLADGEGAYDAFYGFSPAGLVRRNESETAGAYYAMTPWLTLLGEYTHAESKSHGPNNTAADSVSVGAILFY